MVGDVYGGVRKGEERRREGEGEGEMRRRVTVVILDNILEGRAKGRLYIGGPRGMKDGGEEMGIVEMTLSDQEFFFFFPSFHPLSSCCRRLILALGVLGEDDAVGCVGLVYFKSFL